MKSLDTNKYANRTLIRKYSSYINYFRFLEDNKLIKIQLSQFINVPRKRGRYYTVLSRSEVENLFDSMKPKNKLENRDRLIIELIYSTGARVGEVENIRLKDIEMEKNEIKVTGKGRKERLVPIGKGLQRLLWRYVNYMRPEPALVKLDFLFLTYDGRPLGKNLVGARMKRYGRRAGISGVRCSPHTLRHTAAVSFLRNGGNAFSLQCLLGHSSLEMTRHYCELADIDVQNAHATASPVDNLIPVPPSGYIKGSRKRRKIPGPAELR